MDYLFLFLCPIVLSINSAGEKDVISENYTVLSQSGAYCWFQDPRSVFVKGRYNRTYAGWVSADGKLEVGYYDHDNNEVKTSIIKEYWDIDDHNVPSFLVLPDLRLMIFYARHGKENLYARQALEPEDITDWGEEITIAKMNGVTYSHPVFLKDENRFYVFWRGETWKPTFATSKDALQWTEPKILFQEKGKEAKDIRPYLKVVSDNRKTIHFTFTDGHPRNEPFNSVYYARYEAGKFYRADGTYIGTLDTLPIHHSQCDKVYDAKTTSARAWVWDIALNQKGYPVIAYVRFLNENEHFYHYAFWDGKQWVDREITFAGPWFPQTPQGKEELEPHYSGGICVNHAHPEEVYLSKKVDNTFEIERWITRDEGKTWNITPITKHSTVINARPIVPWGYDGDKGHVLWMRGNYIHYTKFQTSIFCWVEK